MYMMSAHAQETSQQMRIELAYLCPVALSLKVLGLRNLSGASAK